MKRIMAFCLSLLFCIFVFAGCGIDSGRTSQIAPQQRTQQTVALEQKAKDSLHKEQAKPAFDSAAATKDNSGKLKVYKAGEYSDKEHVAAYINEFRALPKNYISKNAARQLGWQSRGTLDEVAPGKSIGGDRYGNYEGLLPEKSGRSWQECDIDYVRGNRNGKRIVYSNDGLIYYTDDHYKSFTRLY